MHCIGPEHPCSGPVPTATTTVFAALDNVATLPDSIVLLNIRTLKGCSASPAAVLDYTKTS